MLHDSGKVLMGATLSTAKSVDSYKGEIPAGKVVRLKSDATLSLAKADGAILGVSLGKDLSNAGLTPICRKGLAVPVLLTAAFTPVVGAAVSISDTTGLAIAAGAGATIVNAVYKSAKLKGIDEDGAEVDVALIDFAGGL